LTIPARINIVTLGVEDVARAAEFYEALGWQRSTASMEEIVWFKTTGSILGLFGWRALAEDAHLPAEPKTAFGGITLAINVESEEAVDAALEAAARAGGTIIKPAERADWGGYSGYFTDPDGHAWEVARNPGFPFKADGTLDMP